MIEAAIVRHIAEEYLAEKGNELYVVEVKVKPDNKIIVTIDSDGAPIGIDTCVELSRQIESKLDRETEDFELEVSSAGLTSPLLLVRQYHKYVGKELEVLLKGGVKEVGVLESVDDDSGIVLSVTRMEIPEGGRRKKPVQVPLPIPFDQILKASYHFTF